MSNDADGQRLQRVLKAIEFIQKAVNLLDEDGTAPIATARLEHVLFDLMRFVDSRPSN